MLKICLIHSWLSESLERAGSQTPGFPSLWSAPVHRLRKLFFSERQSAIRNDSKCRFNNLWLSSCRLKKISRKMQIFTSVNI